MTGGVAMEVREDVGLSWLLMVAVPAMVHRHARDVENQG